MIHEASAIGRATAISVRIRSSLFEFLKVVIMGLFEAGVIVLFRPYKFLRVDWHTRETFHVGALFRQRVFHYAEIEARDDHVVPVIADSAQGYVEHGDDAVTKRLVTVQRDGAEELLALGVAGVVGAGVGLERGEIDPSADPRGDLIGT
jgi:hypothetical protein